MATTKDILLGNVSREADAPTERPQPTAAKPESPTPPAESAPKAPAQQPPRMTYEELYNKLYGEQEEEAKKQEERLKRQKRISAIGDGIAALANLFFATKGAPNMFDAKNSASTRARVRYDNFMAQRNADRKLYINGLMKARQADDAKAESDRAWERQLGLDQEARDRFNESIAHRNEREQIADERYNNEQEYKRGRDEESDRRWQATFDEDKRRSDRSYNFQVRQHNDNVAVRREAAAATRARGVRGKQLGFADGNGNQVAIYENVWKGSMQQVYDAMLEDLAPTDETQRRRWEREMRRLDTPQKKEDYVKQNWHKSPRASQIMLTLSGIDPATMTSELNDEVPAGFPRIVEKKKPNPMGGSNAKKDNPMN